MLFKVLVTTLSLLVVFAQIWAARWHFRPERLSLGAILISLLVVLTTLFFLMLTWTTQPVRAPVIVGLVLEAASLALFWAAISASRAAKLRMAFTEHLPHTLLASGPYTLVRHPFYASYILFWIGWAVALWNAWAVVPATLLVIIYVVAARIEERKFLSSSFAAEYQAYCRHAGFLWPHPGGRMKLAQDGG